MSFLLAVSYSHNHRHGHTNMNVCSKGARYPCSILDTFVWELARNYCCYVYTYVQ